jgi:hypothetical protein
MALVVTVLTRTMANPETSGPKMAGGRLCSVGWWGRAAKRRALSGPRRYGADHGYSDKTLVRGQRPEETQQTGRIGAADLVCSLISFTSMTTRMTEFPHWVSGT